MSQNKETRQVTVEKENARSGSEEVSRKMEELKTAIEAQKNKENNG